jgi:hypothetical protein
VAASYFVPVNGGDIFLPEAGKNFEIKGDEFEI